MKLELTAGAVFENEINEAPDDRYAGLTRQDVEHAIRVAEGTSALRHDVDAVYQAWDKLCRAVAVLAAEAVPDRRLTHARSD